MAIIRIICFFKGVIRETMLELAKCQGLFLNWGGVNGGGGGLGSRKISAEKEV